MTQSPPNIETTLQQASRRIADSGSDSPRLDAELLLAHCLGKNRTYLFTWPEKTLSPSEQDGFERLLEKRLQGHPVAHLLGIREFWGMELKVTPDTLIPRPDTEVLVETALQKVPCPRPEQALRLLDLGTGTGAIALALKAERPDLDVTALDFSKRALEVARQNADHHRLSVRFVQSDWFASLAKSERFDVIVSNPPYIEAQDPHLEQGDVRFEPLSALTSGQSGLDDLARIIHDALHYLQPGGWLLVEHGYQQAEAVQSRFRHNGYLAVETVLDYAHQPRITLGQKPEKTPEKKPA